MTYVLAIDPGNTMSAYTLINTTTHQPIDFNKIPNTELLNLLPTLLLHQPIVTIEMVASYGMTVGKEVFETCVWIGRYTQHVADRADVEPILIYRLPVKLHHCGTAKAKDSNITQALIDRFAPGEPNRGKGTKTAPGWFHGFKADIWQSYALAVYVADTLTDGVTPNRNTAA